MNLNLRNTEPETRVGYCRCGCGDATKIGQLSGELNLFVHGHQSRAHVHYKETMTGCWEWQTGTAPSGYGIARVNGRSVRAHRAVYEALVGPIPNGFVLDHICRNKICVNPAHLRVVTAAENTRSGNSAKLSVDDVLNIRELFGQGVIQAHICRIYGLSRTTVCNIVNGKAWLNV